MQRLCCVELPRVAGVAHDIPVLPARAADMRDMLGFVARLPATVTRSTLRYSSIRNLTTPRWRRSDVTQAACALTPVACCASEESQLYGAGPRVRIQLPPAQSQVRISPIVARGVPISKKGTLANRVASTSCRPFAPGQASSANVATTRCAE
jgi:hypothetical protein